LFNAFLNVGASAPVVERVFYGASVQLSLLAAEARAPCLGDLAGLLCGPGQIVRFGRGDTARLSIVLPDPARAVVIVTTCRAVGLDADLAVTDSGGTVVRTPFCRDLVELAAAWTRGAVKAVPPGMHLDGAMLRVWMAAVGRWNGREVELALDAHAPQTHRPLVAALTRAGIPPARTTRGATLRIGGARRVRWFAELVGTSPTAMPAGEWPNMTRRR
jgi:hypothetical protein